MFRDYPEITDEYVDVFYGATDNETRNEVDADGRQSKEVL